MAEFMILMRENDGAWGKLSPDQQQALLEGYFAWVEGLKRDGVLRGGKPLGAGGRLLRAVDGEVTDGPFVETKEVLTGFFLIEAADLEAATEIARGCPALFHGESVELRPVGHLA
ncbi:MAG: YciI family protein [Planctomycetota bacterium]